MMKHKSEHHGKIFFAVLVGGGIVIWGMYLTARLNSLQASVAALNAALNLETTTTPGIVYNPGASSTAASSSTQTQPTSPTSSAQQPVSGLVIPSAISFTALSSPLLTPQSDISVTLNSVAKLDDGSVALSITASAPQAQNYTALEPKALFSIVNGQNTIYPSGVSQGFDSLAPRGSVTGTVTFSPAGFGNAIILKIDAEDGSSYYEFNFATQTYKPASLG